MVMKTIQVAEATGPALDWLVAKCEGYRDANNPEEHSTPEEALCLFNWTLMREPGVAAKWLVDLCYSTDWAQGGPIIEREFITNGPHQIKGEVVGFCALGLKTDWSYGPTPLIAAMRCRVASKLGPTAEVPEELL